MIRILILFALLPLSLQAAESQFETYCGRIILERGTKLRLSAMEKRLICGDQTKDAIGKPWADIPAKQAELFLKTFLQAQGYHNPKFDIRNGDLYVSPGEITKLTKFEVLNPPPEWKPSRKRMIKGKPLTPPLLSSLEDWSMRGVQDVGYACAEANGLADPDTGLVRVELDSNGRKRILEVMDRTDTGLAPGVADRYNAFLIGDYYSETLVQLSRRRLLEDGLMQAVSFSHECFPNGVVIKRDSILGPPRELRIGIGGNTEDGARVRIRGKQIRLGPSASNIEGTIDASFREQKVTTLGRWFYSYYQPRASLEPTIEFRRRQEDQFTSRSWKVGVFHVWDRELSSGNAEFRLGPSWNTFATERGIGPDETILVFLESNLRWLRHESEYYAQSPRRGSRFDLQLLRSQEDWGAPYTATRVGIQGQTLVNLFRYDPPLIVLGLRYELGTTRTEENVDVTALPLEFRFFAGGTDDVRGFNRQTLPRSGAGGLTQALIGFEARAYRALLEQVDPFVFIDAGKLGVKTAQLDDPTYWSPGLGLRWESPVGVLRVFGAYGFISARPTDYEGDDGSVRFGLSFGEEF